MKLIFLDIDGTLVTAGCNVPPSSAMEAIRKARGNGHKVFLCSGRNVGMAAPVFDLGFDGIISLAGAYVLAEGELLYDQPMDPDEFTDLLHLLHEDGVFCTIEARDVTYGDEDLGSFLATADARNSEIERWRKALQGELGIKPMHEYDGRPIYKIVIMCAEAGQLARAKEKYEDRYDFVVQEVQEHGNCLNGELIQRCFDKGKAIRLVADHYGQPISETIGFGDSMNDLTMIQTVGISLCMGNGSETLKKISDHVLPSVEEDGLAKGFELLELI